MSNNQLVTRELVDLKSKVMIQKIDKLYLICNMLFKNSEIKESKSLKVIKEQYLQMYNRLVETGQYEKYKEIINYVIVGGLTTVVSLGTYYICVFTFLNPNHALELQIANVLSWVAGVAFAYFTNRKYVFNSNNPNKLKEAIMFTLSRLVTLVLDMLIMGLGVSILKFNDKIVKLISQVVVVIGNYVFSKLFVFKKADKN